MSTTRKSPINWKVAMAGGGLFGLGVGGLALAGGDDAGEQWPTSVLLDETNTSIMTPSRPVTIPPTTVDSASPAPAATTVAPVTAPAPVPDVSVSAAPVAPAPAPAPDPSVSASPAPAPAPAPDPSWSAASPPSGGDDGSASGGWST